MLPGTCGMPTFRCTPTASLLVPRRVAQGQGHRLRWKLGGKSQKSWPTALEDTWSIFVSTLRLKKENKNPFPDTMTVRTFSSFLIILRIYLLNKHLLHKNGFGKRMQALFRKAHPPQSP